MKAVAARLAGEDGVSLNQSLSVTIAPKIGAVEMALNFLNHQAGKARRLDMLCFSKRRSVRCHRSGMAFEKR